MKFNEGFTATGVGIAHHFGGGMYAKETRIPAGVELFQHTHSFDHLSILASGVVYVNVNGVDKIYAGPACILIEANKAHAVRAVSDAVWFCCHATSCTDPEKVDQELAA